MTFSKLQQYLFENVNYNPKVQQLYAIGFVGFTILALGIDSVFFTKHFFDARIITNVAAVLYFLLMFCSAEVYLRKLMFVMVFLSYIGELIFCKLLHMYDYRTSMIPLYVPFGHAIVYASGYIFAHSKWSLQNDGKLRVYFALFFILLFLGVGFFLNDCFTLLFGLLFFLLLKRKQWQNLYYFIALCVIFIELVGTYFGCWRWASKSFGLIPAANPPMGAVFFYAGGDVLLAKIVAVWDQKKSIKL